MSNKAIKRLKKRKQLESKTSHEQVDENGNIIKDAFYQNIYEKDLDGGEGKYLTKNEVLNPKTGKYEYYEHYNKVDKSGAHIIKPIIVKAKKRIKK